MDGSHLIVRRGRVKRNLDIPVRDREAFKRFSQSVEEKAGAFSFHRQECLCHLTFQILACATVNCARRS